MYRPEIKNNGMRCRCDLFKVAGEWIFLQINFGRSHELA